VVLPSLLSRLSAEYINSFLRSQKDSGTTVAYYNERVTWLLIEKERMLVWHKSTSDSNKVVLPALIPPLRFSVVEGSNRSEALYRSAFPTYRNYRYLKRLKLKTIISLVPRNHIQPSFTEFCKNNNITHIIHAASGNQKPLDASQDDPIGPAPTHFLCAQVLTTCIDRERLPLLIHCTNGAHVTGLIIALLRKLQYYSQDSYLEEFVRFTKYHSIEEDERMFIMRYFNAVTLPGSLPLWLWGGERPTRHHTVPLFAAAVSVGLGPDDVEAEKDFYAQQQHVSVTDNLK